MDYESYANACAFIGNSLLKPMSQTETVGLDPAFWSAFPHFDDPVILQAKEALIQWAKKASVLDEGQAIQGVSVEFTHLFVGPPSPAAPPWETVNREEGVTVGFGQPTFAMQGILRDMGLVVSNENNQYADHMGIEHLTLSAMCRRVGAGQMDGEVVCAFMCEHPAAWVSTFHGKVHDAVPGGYYDHLLALAEALLLRAVGTRDNSSCA